ncbi:UDP:flavonoid glycosyltransferase YjiC (YdhE family) [Micromonospora pisi]|uniref:UDP:flavonoid glycosyltransferase YjiC (YdhE family) n=1 Tax=Micromonospora pisi TaxID=589240 RepID=A0A495JTV6_9ACTN|nr:nucleotide disphospho-sugar-binding domain-containing protein [Micromonospora pisi]RKR92261.1 UDP:flavonoid glycosyltransferase YjiC (YdhE family) [Micromonospora pisi]
MATVLLVSHGTHGDVWPMIHLGAGLRGRGHAVTLLTHTPYGDPVRRAGLRFVPIDTAEEYAAYLEDARRILLSRVGSPSPPDLLAHYHRTNLFGQLRAEVEHLCELTVPGETVLVGRHTSGLAPLIAGQLRDVPVAWVAMTPAQHLLLPVTEHLHRTALAGPINQLRAGFGLGPVDDWGTFLGSADLQLGLWPRWFDAAGDPTPDRVAKVGFLLDSAGSPDPEPVPPEVAELLSGEVPPVLVAGSSGQMLLHDFYSAAVPAALDAGRTVLLVSPYRELLPATLPTGVHWFRWLPYGSVMPRVAVVVHHGGTGTIARCLAAGVPQLVLAHSFDQPDTGARLRRLGVGEWLPSTQWEPARATALMRRLLDGRDYRDRALRLRAAVGTASVDQASRRIEALLTPADATAR